MKIGYARVSTIDQHLEAQTDALKAFGCEEIYQEKISAASKERPVLQEMLGKIRKGDTVVVYKLDRLGRSLKDLTRLITGFSEKDIQFVSLSENIDTATTSGKLLFHIMASLAEFERELIVERTHAGLKSARARGRVGGRPKGLSHAYKEKAASILALYESEKVSNDQIRKDYKIGSKETLYKILAYARENRK